MHSAGVLPYSADVRVLVGSQRRQWTSLAGTARPGETPIETAAREFHEETAGLFGVDVVKDRIAAVEPLVSITPSGRSFYLFCIRMSPNDAHAAEHRRLRLASVQASHLEMDEIRWIALDELRGHALRGPFRRDFARICKHVRASLETERPCLTGRATRTRTP